MIGSISVCVSVETDFANLFSVEELLMQTGSGKLSSSESSLEFSHDSFSSISLRKEAATKSIDFKSVFL